MKESLSARANTTMSSYIIDDKSIDSRSQDVLRRGSLVDLVVNAIKTKVASKHSAVCFGVLGGWGEGKTSFMRMIEEELRENDNTRTLWFNPWDQSSPERMVIEFFSSLSRLAIDESKTLSMAINSYGNAFFASSVSLNDPETYSYRERLSHCIPGFSDMKDFISKELVSRQKHIIFFIDDVDRLQAPEIRTVFKLIRQIADFDNVIYLVGIDPEIVAVALGDPYGNNKILGRDYLKKFVQIPIILPPIQDSRLQLLFTQKLSRLIDEFDVEVSHDEISIVGKTVAGALRTIRDINRLINQLNLVLPILHTETEFVDLCLIESLKFLNEQGWLSVYDHMDALLNINRPPVLVAEEFKNRYENAIRSILSYYPGKNQTYVSRILTEHLFPQQQRVFDPASKSICNEVYFRQYFICGVPDGIIPQRDLLDFKKRIDENDIQSAVSWLNSQAVLYSATELDRVARTCLYISQKNSCDTEELAYVTALSLSFSRLADGFSFNTIQNKNSIDTTIGCVIVPFFLGKYDHGNFVVNKHRESLLLMKIFSHSPINFCMNLMHAVYSKYGITPSDEIGVFRVLRERVIKEGQLFIFEYSFVIKQVYFMLWRKTDSAGCNAFLTRVLEREDFDIGLEIKNWLEAAGEKEELQQIAYLSDIYNPVFETLRQNLSRSSLREDSLVKKFVVNCGKFDVNSDKADE